ncbi:hypothetical protein Scep_013387 [Stephania cephalantha]|uniref:Uncharacterized protein n=1 Tax=Stephania cephalantha TaxID=152367 RepID=A0AAP0JH12_9MAGN
MDNRDLGVGCRVRKSRRERDILRFAISRGHMRTIKQRVHMTTLVVAKNSTARQQANKF